MAVEPFTEHHFTSQDGLRLYYRDYGAGRAGTLPLVCLTGLTRNSSDFADFAGLMGRTRRIVCPDYRGRGHSDRDPEWRNYQPAIYLNDIKHLLAVTGIARAVFVGTSLGAFLSMGMAVAAPTAVAGAVLNDAGPDVDQSGLSRILDYIGKDRPQESWDDAVATLRAMFPNLSINTEEGWLDMARGTFREGTDGKLHYNWDTNIAKAIEHGPPTPDLWPVFRSLRNMPVLAIRGELSDVLSADTFERMGTALPHIATATVPGVGHAPTLAEPEAAEAIESYLARLH